MQAANTGHGLRRLNRLTQDRMDTQGHQPGEELADFTEEELLSLIDAGTTGAYSEIYRRYVDDAVARTLGSGVESNPQEVVDDAFLAVLRSLLNGTADISGGLKHMVSEAIDERLADVQALTSDEDAVGVGVGVDVGVGEEDNHVLVARALSTLPDNWQRILWLRKVERLTPQAVADQLNITTTVVDRLSLRAQQDLQEESNRIGADGLEDPSKHRSALIAALLTSPIVIEGLADTLAMTTPDPASSPVTTAVSDETAKVPTSEGAAVLVPAESAELTVMNAGVGPEPQTVRTSAKPAFTMPKPVLIPVVAACIGLLATLIGLAIVPQHGEQTGLRSGDGSANISPADSSPGEQLQSPDSQPPAEKTSSKDNQGPGPENAQEPKPNSSAKDKDGTSSRKDSARGNDDRTEEDSPSDGDSSDRPSSNRPDDPRPSDSDRPDPDSPSEPGTPSEPESPSEPDEPSAPGPTQDDPSTGSSTPTN